MYTLQLKTTTREFPEHISELSTHQWREFAEAYLMMQSGILDYKAMCVRMVYKFLALRREVDTSKDTSIQAVRNIHYLAQTLDSWFEPKVVDGKTNYEIKLDFFSNPVPQLSIKGNKYQAPAVLVGGLNFGDYVAAYNAYNDYGRHNTDEYLHRLISVMYKPVGHKTAIDPSLVDPIDQFLIFLNFAAIQQFITTAHALDMGGGVILNIAQLFKSDAKSKNKSTNFGLVGALHSLAKEGTFGNKEELSKVETWEVLSRMVQLHEDAKQLKRDAKNKRNKNRSK